MSLLICPDSCQVKMKVIATSFSVLPFAPQTINQSVTDTRQVVLGPPRFFSLPHPPIVPTSIPVYKRRVNLWRHFLFYTSNASWWSSLPIHIHLVVCLGWRLGDYALPRAAAPARANPWAWKWSPVFCVTCPRGWSCNVGICTWTRP